jgi:guanylate kinase
MDDGPGILLILSAPLGAGKMTLRQFLLACRPNVRLSVSHTTRPARAHEVHGQEFLFTNRADFDKKAAEGLFLEWSTIHGQCYGTAKSPLLDDLKSGRDVVATVDIQGAQALKKAIPEAVRVFLCPPTWEELSAYLKGRLATHPQAMDQAIERARGEMKAGADFEYILLHKDFKSSSAGLCAILDAERWRAERSHAKVRELAGESFTASAAVRPITPFS